MTARTEGVYGPGTWTDQKFVPVPEECKQMLSYLASNTPGFSQDSEKLEQVVFHGGDLPILPGPLKAQVLTATLHAMLGIAAGEISTLRGVAPGKILIDTDHAGMFPGTVGILSIDGKEFVDLAKAGVPTSVGADLDGGVLHGTPMRYRTWAIYPTSDPSVYYQILSSMDPVGLLEAYNLDVNAASTNEEAYDLIKAAVSKYSARELELKHMELGFCGQTCYTPAQWQATLMGKELARHPLINYHQVKASTGLGPVPFPVSQGDARPLAGMKVVEMSRIIAAPAMGMVLASLGAEVIRIQPPHLHDIQPLNLTLTAGKRTCGLDLNDPEDYKAVVKLISEADVFIQAFRLRSLERRGLGREDVMEMARERGRGIVYVDLNCYGPDGYYAERPGYQQIADAASGCSYVCGKAYGFPEGTAVLPSLPVADMVCGLVGALDAVLALRDRATKGGSYYACSALTSVDTIQLYPEVGLYPPEVAQQVQEKFKFAKMTPDLMVEDLMIIVSAAWRDSSDLLKNDEYFTTFPKSAFGVNHRILAPVIKFEKSEVNPHWKSPPVPYCWEKNPSFT